MIIPNAKMDHIHPLSQTSLYFVCVGVVVVLSFVPFRVRKRYLIQIMVMDHRDWIGLPVA